MTREQELEAENAKLKLQLEEQRTLISNLKELINKTLKLCR